ncbi:DMSO/selenate family reductase complex A subunit [Edaphovirga cremea]|uniref:DMSO/selenate family reductase complex A subunit n=1 Tax=Edaphovirga cremea TaxID=2267246 RepID=UPI003988E6AC
MSKISKDLLLRDISRRQFLGTTTKTMAAIGIANSLSLPFSAFASSPAGAGGAAEMVKHSACLVNCGSRCPLKVIVKDDTIIRIEAEDCVNDSIFGQHRISPCLRGRSSRWRVYSPDRIKYPMKRIGKRGEGKFERITWEEATSTIAKEMTRIKEKYGNEAFYYNYQSGAYYHTQGTTVWQRLLNLNGGYLRYYNTYSTAQISVATPFSHGGYFASHFDQVKNSDLVVFFGMNLSETRMSGGGQVEEMRRALEQSRAKVVIIDPRYTDSVITGNAEWMPIRPTTDAALVAGMVHTLIVENLLNEEQINQYCIGFDSTTLPETAPKNAGYKDYILGNGDDKTVKTPEWAADVTGIPAGRIRQLAREIANAKACYIAQGWGPQRHANGEQSVRAIQMLPALTGHFGLPGTNTGNWPYAKSYGVPKIPAGDNPIKTAIPCYLWTDAIATPEMFTPTTWGLKEAEKLKTGIKFVLNQAGNTLLNQHGNINRTKKILADDTQCEMIVVIDNHMTSSAKFADILLPETSYLEAEDLVDNSYASGSNNFMISIQPTVKPMWEVRSTYDICADIAGHLGMREKFTTGLTQPQWVEKHYAEIKAKRPHLPEWSVAKHMGVIDQEIATDEESVAFSDFRRSPQDNPLKTPSGKIEIYSARLADIAAKWVLQADEKITPIPEFCPSWESHLDTVMKEKYPLQMIGFHTKGRTHSTYHPIPQLREAVPDEIWINPMDAQARGLQAGDVVRVYNDRGIIEIKTKLTHRIAPGVVGVPQGAWEQVNAEGVDIGGCINTLTHHRPSPLAKGNPQHTNLVEIRKA